MGRKSANVQRERLTDRVVTQAAGGRPAGRGQGESEDSFFF